MTDINKKQLETYSRMLLEWNEKMNLTAITNPEEVQIKHFEDSLLLLEHLDIKQNASVIDVGTGAGFPGLVLKIARPDLKVTLLDSLNKRLIFLKAVCDEIGVEVDLIHSRAEDAGRDEKCRAAFDYAVSRAVSALPALCEYCLPLIKTGGVMAAMKGPEMNEELNNAMDAIKLLGGGEVQKKEYTLPNGDGRSLVTIKKISQTPTKYPRKGVKISKTPL